jgi:hypothetical protein
MEELLDPKSHWKKFAVAGGSIHGGGQIIFRFPNGYGASVVQHSFSYGHESGLFELAVIKFRSNHKDPHGFTITYETSITEGVLGYLSKADIFSTLAKIEAFPPLTKLIEDGRISEIKGELK